MGGWVGVHAGVFPSCISSHTCYPLRQVVMQKRDVVPDSLVKELLATSMVTSARGLEAFMNEGQGRAVIEMALKKEGSNGRHGGGKGKL